MVKLDGKKISAAMRLAGLTADSSALAHHVGLAGITAEDALNGKSVSGLEAHRIADTLGVPESDLIVAELKANGKWHKVDPTDNIGTWLVDKINHSAACVIGLVSKEQRDTAQQFLREIIVYAGMLETLKHD